MIQREFFFNNVQFESTVTYYLVCNDCGEELECSVPQEVPLTTQEFTVKVKPHDCE